MLYTTLNPINIINNIFNFGVVLYVYVFYFHFLFYTYSITKKYRKRTVITQKIKRTTHSISDYLSKVKLNKLVIINLSCFNSKYNIFQTLRNILKNIIMLNKISFSFGFYYIQGFICILFIDACLTDDEPL